MNSGPSTRNIPFFNNFATGMQMGLKAIYRKLNHVKLMAVGDYSDLIESLHDGRLEDVELLIRKSEFENQWHLQRNLALRLSLEKGYLSVAQRLLQNPLVVQELSQSGHLVLYKAMELYVFKSCQFHLEFFQWLLDTFPEIQNTAADGGNAVLARTVHHNCEVLFDILIQQPTVMNAIAVGSNRVLSSAAASKQFAMVNRLLKIPNVVDELRHSGRMALGHACGSGELLIVKRLLDFPEVAAQVHQNAAFMGPAILSAARHGRLSVVKYLLQFQSVRQSLQNSALSSQLLCAAVYCDALDVMDTMIQVPGVRQSLSADIVLGHPFYSSITLGRESFFQYFLAFDEVKQQLPGNALVVELAFRYHRKNMMNQLCQHGASLKGISDFWAPPHLHLVNGGAELYEQEAHDVLNNLFSAYISLKHRHKVNKIGQNQKPALISNVRNFPEPGDRKAELEYAQGIISHPNLPLDVAKKINSYLPFTTAHLSQRYSIVAKTQVDIEEVEELEARLENLQL